MAPEDHSGRGGCDDGADAKDQQCLLKLIHRLWLVCNTLRALLLRKQTYAWCWSVVFAGDVVLVNRDPIKFFAGNS
jgi:hypothetical protein